jgi:hypothetical protein
MGDRLYTPPVEFSSTDYALDNPHTSLATRIQ